MTNKHTPSTLKTLIRYPGDKPKAASLILSHIPKNITGVHSIFLTGGSIELLLSSKNINVRAFTHNKELLTFWACASWDSLKVAKIAQQFRDLLSEEAVFYNIQERRNESKDPFVRAALFFALNRSTKNGHTSSGKFEPDCPRFNDKSLYDLANSNFKNLIVNHTEDYISEIDENGDVFLFCCPYEKYSSRQHSMTPAPMEKRKIDHLKLREKLINRKNWLLLYELNDEVLDAYAGFDYKLYTDSFRKVNKSNKANQILIFANNL